MTAAIAMLDLAKTYPRGLGLRRIALEVPPGEIFGFLGPNGAGKTTAIRTLLGFLRPTGGEARIFGHDVWREREAVHARVGYLPGEVKLRGDWTPAALFARAARLRGADTAYAHDLADRLGLRAHARLGTLSKGNRQKIGVVLALMFRSPLLILDEPTDGLDPLAQESVLELLRGAKNEGRTVFLSSHALSEVERVADRVGLIRAGELVRVDGLAALKASLPQVLEVEYGAAPGRDLALLPGLSGVTRAGLHLRGLWRGAPGPLLDALRGEPVARFTLSETSLEDAFAQQYREEVRA